VIRALQRGILTNINEVRDTLNTACFYIEVLCVKFEVLLVWQIGCAWCMRIAELHGEDTGITLEVQLLAWQIGWAW
jgi:hypothetical protein